MCSSSWSRSRILERQYCASWRVCASLPPLIQTIRFECQVTVRVASGPRTSTMTSRLPPKCGPVSRNLLIKVRRAAGLPRRVLMSLDYGVTRAPARLIFGPGQRRSIGTAAASLGKRALVCTDARFADLPVMQEILSDLNAHGVQAEVFSDTQAELPLEGILACVDRYRHFSPEVVIGIGGGSCIDLAKLVSLLLVHPAPLSLYYGEFKVPGPIIPVIAVPTTSGTGAEVTPVAVLGDPGLTMKVGISSPELIPHTAICDPELTLTCPRGLTAISG